MNEKERRNKMGNPPMTGLQMAKIDLAPTDKFILVSLPERSSQPQIVMGPNQTLIDSLLLTVGVLETLVSHLMQQYPDDSRIVQPYAAPVRLNPNGQKGNGN